MTTRNVPVYTLLLVLTLPGFAHGQTVAATVRGVVNDSSGAACGRAQVTLVNEETNERRNVLTDSDGGFTLSVLPPGLYRAEAELAGFRRYIGRQIVLQVGQDARLTIVLEPGAPSDQVVVTADQALVSHDTTAVRAVIENRQIVSFPLDGRNFLQLSLLIPGTAPAAQGSPGSVRGELAVNVNGAREDSNNFILDGVYNNDPKLNSFAINPPVDAIREFEILTGTYDAAFGRSGGAQVNVALKSGTNRIFGTVYEFFRNAALDAENFFAHGHDETPRYQRNQFGFSFGGPFCKDRTFFFADYEGRRMREGITQVTNVPSAHERLGDFSQSLLPLPVDPFIQQPFAGGQIPSDRLNPIGRAIAGLYPLPNRNVPGQNFISSPVLRDRDDRFDVRIDHALSYSSDLVARYSFSDRNLYEPFSGPTFARVPGFGTLIPRRAQNFMIGENHVFSPDLVSELRFGFNRIAAGTYHENRGSSINQRLGLPELSSNARDFGLSFITISGFSPLGDEYNNPQHSVTNTFQVLENVSWIRGKHLLKAGVEFRRLQQNAFRDVQSRGLLTFSDFGQITGNGLADLLLGFVSFSGGARMDNPQYLRSHSWNTFVQDSYRIRRNVTLLFGLRYELNSPPVDRFDRANVYDPAARALLPVGQNGIPRSGYFPDRNNWAPRVGIAWSPGAGDTVIHAGYGVYYDQSSLAPGEGLYFNPPYYDFSLYFPLPGLPLTVHDPFPRNYPFRLPASALGFDRMLRTPYVQHWNLKVQRQIGSDRVMEVAYVGSKGTKLISGRDVNQADAGPQQPNLRPDPQFADVLFIESRANSTYHSLQARFQQRFRRGVSALASYTLGQSLDNASTFFSSSGDSNFPQNSWNVAAEKGRSNFDIRHRLSFSYSYDLPLGRSRQYLGGTGFLPALLTGWTTNGIVTLQTGRPFTVALLSEIDNSNTGRAALGFGANDRPHRVGNGRLHDPTPERWFDTAAFAFPDFGSFGDSGRNILEGPGYHDFSLNLIKDTALNETLKLQFRAELFNVLNHTNFDLPDIFLGSPTFGRVLSAASPRRIQFGLKLVF
jgi:hypothetical protein